MPGILTAIRQNHALEHATIHLLSRRKPYLRLVGRTTPAGFVIYGVVDTEEVADAASEAIVRLQQGESYLAVHPRCGTNLVVTGIMAGTAAFIFGAGDRHSKLERLPLALAAATLAAIAAQPVALEVQKRVTTTPAVEGTCIAGITRQELGKVVVHQVAVSRG